MENFDFDFISAINGKCPVTGQIFDNAIHAYWLDDEIVYWEVREDKNPQYPNLRPC